MCINFFKWTMNGISLGVNAENSTFYQMLVQKSMLQDISRWLNFCWKSSSFGFPSSSNSPWYFSSLSRGMRNFSRNLRWRWQLDDESFEKIWSYITFMTFSSSFFYFFYDWKIFWSVFLRRKKWRYLSSDIFHPVFNQNEKCQMFKI